MRSTHIHTFPVSNWEKKHIYFEMNFKKKSFAQVQQLAAHLSTRFNFWKEQGT